MDEGVATFSGLFLDRSGWNLKLRFSLYSYDRSTGDWNETGVHFDTAFFHVAEGVPAALLLEQVKRRVVHSNAALTGKIVISPPPPCAREIIRSKRKLS